MPQEALALLAAMVHFHPALRATVDEALAHPFFTLTADVSTVSGSNGTPASAPPFGHEQLLPTPYSVLQQPHAVELSALASVDAAAVDQDLSSDLDAASGDVRFIERLDDDERLLGASLDDVTRDMALTLWLLAKPYPRAAKGSGYAPS